MLSRKKGQKKAPERVPLSQRSAYVMSSKASQRSSSQLSMISQSQQLESQQTWQKTQYTNFANETSGTSDPDEPPVVSSQTKKLRKTRGKKPGSQELGSSDEEEVQIGQESEEAFDYERFMKRYIRDHITLKKSNETAQKGMRRKWKGYWKIYMDYIEAQMGEGLPEIKIMDLWRIISDEPHLAPREIRRDLIYFMIPAKNSLPEILIDDIVQWLCFAKDEKDKPICRALLIYLFGIAQYELVDTSILSSPLNYHQLFALRRMEPLQEYTFLLLRRITTPLNVTRKFVSDLNFVLRNWLLKKDEINALKNLIAICKILRPDLVHVKDTDITFKRDTKRYVTLLDASRGFRERLYGARGRISQEKLEGLISEEDIRISGLFFLHWAPSFIEDYSVLMRSTRSSTALDEMKLMLINRETTPLLLGKPLHLELFYDWLDLVLKHEFIPSAHNALNREKYAFVLDRCLLLLEFMDSDPLHVKGITPLNNWMLSLLRKWDGEMFKSHIFRLFSFLPILDFKIYKNAHALDVFEREFTQGDQEDRVAIWEMLNTLFTRWIKLLNRARISQNVEQGELAGNLQFLFNYMCVLVNEMTDGHNQPYLLAKVCEAFDNYEVLYETKGMPFQPIPPVTLTFRVILSDSLLTLEPFCRLVLRLKNKKGDLNVEDSDAHKTMISEITTYFKKSVGPPVLRLFYREMEKGLSEENCTLIETACKNLLFLKGRACEPYLKMEGKKSVLQIAELWKDAPNVAEFCK